MQEVDCSYWKNGSDGDAEVVAVKICKARVQKDQESQRNGETRSLADGFGPLRSAQHSGKTCGSGNAHEPRIPRSTETYDAGHAEQRQQEKIKFFLASQNEKCKTHQQQLHEVCVAAEIQSLEFTDLGVRKLRRRVIEDHKV